MSYQIANFRDWKRPLDKNSEEVNIDSEVLSLVRLAWCS